MEAIVERGYNYGKEYIGNHSSYEATAEQEDVTKAYICGAREQLQNDINMVELILYNAFEIGDVNCKDIKKVIESIKRGLVNLSNNI